MKYHRQRLRFGLRRFGRVPVWSRLLCLLLGLPLSWPSLADTVSGVVSGGQVVQGATQDVVSGGVAIQVEVDGTQNVSAGGQTSGTVGTGEQNIYSGGLASGTAMSGSQSVYRGGVASASEVSGFQYVVGGHAVGTTVLSRGAQGISADGSAVGTTIRGGLQEVQAGGMPTAPTAPSGTQRI